MRKQAIFRMAAAGIAVMAMMAAPGSIRAQEGAAANKGTAKVLTPAETQKLLPASVYYCGQPANTQWRNSGGVKFADGHYVLAILVDTTGYSTALASKYQAYFIAEVPIKVGGESLPAGVYGVGFVGDKLVVTDVGAHDVLTVASHEDSGLKRLMPLQVLADPVGGFRLYAGHKYVSFIR